MQSSLLDLVGVVVLALLAAFGVIASLVFVLGRLLEHSENRRPCPECNETRLLWIKGARATILVHGRHAPDSWSLHECLACGVRLKNRSGKWEPAGPSDLRHYAPKDSVSG